LKGCPTSPELRAGQFGVGPLVTTKGHDVSAVVPVESFTETVKLPPADAVPVIAPVEEFNDKPAGKVPALTKKVYGATPPLTPIGGLFTGTPAWNELLAGHVTTIGDTTTENGQVLAATAPVESLSWTVKLPVTVGVPVIAPVEEFSDKPVGREPLETKKVYGGTPPLAVTLVLTGWLIVKVLTTAHVSTKGGGITENGQESEVAPLASLTCTVKDPVAVGVPVIAPVEEFKLKPAGRVPLATEKVKGPPPPVTVIAGLFTGDPTVNWLLTGQLSCGPVTITNGQVVAAVAPPESFI
jgi:hypothetical protein